MTAPLPIPALGSTVVDANGNSGIAKFNPNDGTPLADPSGGNSSLITALQNSILSQSGMVSSSNSTLQNNITALQNGGTASDAATNLQYNTDEANLNTSSLNDSLNGRAQGSGGVMNLAALNELTQNTDKQMAQYEQQRQQALLSNDAATAKAVSDAQLQALQFQQKANQDVFSNLLNLGQFGLAQQTEDRAQAAAADEHSKNLVEMIQDNPQAGITMNDTIEQAAAKIGQNPNSPDVQLKKAQISKIYSDIKNGNSGGNLTDAQQTQNAYSYYNGVLQPGNKLYPGTKNQQDVIDPTTGKITAGAWNKFIQEAPSNGISRDDFVRQYGYLLYTIPGAKGAKAIPTTYNLSTKDLEALGLK